MKIPIACRLEAGEARSQLGEWERVLRQVVARRERVAPQRVELSLRPEADLAAIASLAQRETVCCPFFTFTLAIWADRLVLVIEVPSDAVALLDELIAGAA